MNLQELWSEIQDLHSDFFLAQGSQKLEKLKNWKLDQGFSSMIQFYFNWIEASSKIEKCHQKVEFPYSTVESQNQEKS